MKKYFAILFLCFLMVRSEKGFCQSNHNTDAEKLKKKGAAYSVKADNWSRKTSELKPHWMYNWSSTRNDKIPENVEFVPMFYSGNSVNNENLKAVKGYIKEGKVKYVLAFNEPERPKQGYTSVDQAIAVWPKLEALGVPIVSPSGSAEWMEEFMKKVEEKGLRVDYIAVHNYSGPNVTALMSKLQKIYLQYKRPIWVTEWAVADWNAKLPEQNRWSSETIMNYMDGILKAFDDSDFIFRYAWFDTVERNPAITTSSLSQLNGELTPLGKKYASSKPNMQISVNK